MQPLHSVASRLASLALVLAACAPLDYDLAALPIPISAKRVPAAANVTPMRIESRNTLWIHGLAGHQTPDVAALVEEASRGYDRIAGFRVKQETNIHHWLLTHLSLTLVRMKRVVIEGQLIRDESAVSGQAGH